MVTGLRKYLKTLKDPLTCSGVQVSAFLTNAQSIPDGKPGFQAVKRPDGQGLRWWQWLDPNRTLTSPENTRCRKDRPAANAISQAPFFQGNPEVESQSYSDPRQHIPPTHERPGGTILESTIPNTKENSLSMDWNFWYWIFRCVSVFCWIKDGTHKDNVYTHTHTYMKCHYTYRLYIDTYSYI